MPLTYWQYEEHREPLDLLTDNMRNTVSLWTYWQTIWETPWAPGFTDNMRNTVSLLQNVISWRVECTCVVLAVGRSPCLPRSEEQELHSDFLPHPPKSRHSEQNRERSRKTAHGAFYYVARSIYKQTNLIVYETMSHCIAQVSLELRIFLPQFLKILCSSPSTTT